MMNRRETANPIMDAVAGPPPVNPREFWRASHDGFSHPDTVREFHEYNLLPLFRSQGMFKWMERIKAAGVPLEEQMLDGVKNVLTSLLVDSSFFSYESVQTHPYSGPVIPKLWQSHSHTYNGYEPDNRIGRALRIGSDPAKALKGKELDTLEETFNLTSWDMLAQGARILGQEETSRLISGLLHVDQIAPTYNWDVLIYPERSLQVAQLCFSFNPPLQLTADQRGRLGDILSKFQRVDRSWSGFYRNSTNYDRTRYQLINETTLSLIDPEKQEIDLETPRGKRGALANQYWELHRKYYGGGRKYALAEAMQKIMKSSQGLIPNALANLPDLFFAAADEVNAGKDEGRASWYKDGSTYKKGIFNWFGLETDAEKQFGTFLLTLPLIAPSGNDYDRLTTETRERNHALLNQVRKSMLGKIKPRDMALIENYTARILQVESIEHMIERGTRMTPEDVVTFIKRRADEYQIGLILSNSHHPASIEDAAPPSVTQVITTQKEKRTKRRKSSTLNPAATVFSLSLA